MSVHRCRVWERWGHPDDLDKYGPVTFPDQVLVDMGAPFVSRDKGPRVGYGIFGGRPVSVWMRDPRGMVWKIRSPRVSLNEYQDGGSGRLGDPPVSLWISDSRGSVLGRCWVTLDSVGV